MIDERKKCPNNPRGWSGGAMVLVILPVPGRPTILISVGQGPTALAVGAGGGCLDIFTLIYPFSPLSPSLWETARYRLKHCLKGPLNQKKKKKKNNQTTPTHTYCKRSRPLPYYNPNYRTPRTESLPRTIAPPDHPLIGKKIQTYNTEYL